MAKDIFDLHDDDIDDTEMYDDAAVRQAQKDYVESGGSENDIIDEEEKIKRRTSRFNNPDISNLDDDDGGDPRDDGKWERFKT